MTSSYDIIIWHHMMSYDDVIWWWSQAHVKIILWSFWGHFGVILGSLWGHFGVMLGSFWDHFGIILGSSWGHLGVILGSLWGHFGIILGWSQKYFSKYFQIFSAPFLMIPSPSPSFLHPHHAKKWYDFSLITPDHAILKMKSGNNDEFTLSYTWRHMH